VTRGASREEAELKALLQKQSWEERWVRIQRSEATRLERVRKKYEYEKQVDIDKRARVEAVELTREAEAAIAVCKDLLASSLSIDHGLDWIPLYDLTAFNKSYPSAPQLKELPPEPLRTEERFQVQHVVPKIDFTDRLIPGRRNQKENRAALIEGQRRRDADRRYSEATAKWKQHCDATKSANDESSATYEKAKIAWMLEKQVFGEVQKRYNVEIEAFKSQYFDRSPHAVKRYCSEVVSRSQYPDSFPKDCVVAYEDTGGILVLDYELPQQQAIPNVKNVKYVSSRGEFQNVYISEAESKRLYDEVLYQICLRTIYEVLQADEVNAVKSVVFNGWVQAVDKATGADTHPCVMTVQVEKTDFLGRNLNQVDLKACFRSLKGVSGGKLIDFTPVRPVMVLDRTDPRFVEAFKIADSLNDETNLAAMDWLDFENLIRELFEKEFSKNGGEVKITQASRDGGVDAIAFDPDPLRGGKIIIQAKRYTNTVGIAAVRDLFGTVHNEGATKGILVTTSDYGPDAYEFVKGKPLTLLSGSELLYLLGKHGYKAKINLSEAKKILGNI
jgi:restriction system protein